MFLSTNRASELFPAFQKELGESFNEREIRLMIRLALEKRLGLERGQLLFLNECRLSESDINFFENLLGRLQKGEPYQYILGEAHFYGLTLSSDQRALIPRPETEELVAWILEEQKEGKHTLIDWGTGSGCIALAIKAERPEWKVYAADLSEESLELAAHNGSKLDLDIQVLKADILNPDQTEVASSCDIWVSNPPYIPLKDREHMNSNVLDYEPSMALFVPDEDPLKYYRNLAEGAVKMLPDTGKIYLEVHEEYGAEVEQLFLSLKFREVSLRQDLQGKNRMLRAVK
ncbi:MAG: peptide chain release factor N(5)-glutamine methyltransferase [Bacteroidetes bacterium]|nr:MAG: peptide chain release factor N(5)-glutamine methyltransferase [Bacteroidota bacterium]